MDESKKIALIRKIRRMQHQMQRGQEKEILISLDDYFDGDNSKYCTILENITHPLSPQDFHQFLRNIAIKPEVSHVLIRFYDYEDALDCDDSWINSDTVYIMTSAPLSDVKEWFSPLEPSTVNEEPAIDDFANLPDLPNSHKLVAVWWD